MEDFDRKLPLTEGKRAAPLFPKDLIAKLTILWKRQKAPGAAPATIRRARA